MEEKMMIKFKKEGGYAALNPYSINSVSGRSRNRSLVVFNGGLVEVDHSPDEVLEILENIGVKVISAIEVEAE